METVILSICLVAVAFVLLGVKVLFVKGGKFPSGHVHSSPALRRRGVSCEAHHAVPVKNNIHLTK